MADKFFSIWLRNTLNAKDMKPADLSRSAKINEATLSRLLKDQQKPKVQTLIRIADSLNIPREEAFRAAGFLHKNPDQKVEDLARRIAMLPQDQQNFIDSLIDTILKKGGAEIEKKETLQSK